MKDPKIKKCRISNAYMDKSKIHNAARERENPQKIVLIIVLVH